MSSKVSAAGQLDVGVWILVMNLDSGRVRRPAESCILKPKAHMPHVWKQGLDEAKHCHRVRRRPLMASAREAWSGQGLFRDREPMECPGKVLV